MKNQKANGLHKAELTSDELRLLVEYYSDALDELKDPSSPVLIQMRDELSNRRNELERMFDGRWTNRGKGRKPKAPVDLTHPLPMEQTQTCAAVQDIDA